MRQHQPVRDARRSYAGVAFDRTQNDPDACLSINRALYAWAAAQGLDIDAGRVKWPANGQSSQPLAAGNAVTFEGTHPKGPAHAGIAAGLVPALSGALSF